MQHCFDRKINTIPFGIILRQYGQKKIFKGFCNTFRIIDLITIRSLEFREE